MIGFHEIRFPEDVSWGSKGGPVFKTQVFTSLRGYEKRNVDWSQPMMKFNAAYGIRTDVQIMNVLNFFNARQGQLFGFRYKNWCNYRIRNAPFATGDGFNKRLPIYKFYTISPEARHYKRLRKIVRGSVRGVTVSGNPLVEGVDFNIDYDSGEIALNYAPGYGVGVFCENLEFDEPVRFDDDSVKNVIDAFNNNNLSDLSLIGVRGTFSRGSVFSPDFSEQGDTDPYFGRTFLLLNFDTPSTPTTFTDQSVIGNAINVNGSATIDGETYRHGSGSLRLGPNGFLSIGGDPFVFGDNRFTVEFFAQRPEDGEAIQPIVGRWQDAGFNRSWMVRYNFATDRIELVLSEDGDNARVVISHPWESTSGFFDYISIDRAPGNWYILRVNGEVKQTVKDVGPIFGGTALLTVGSVVSPGTGVGSFQGRIDSIRVTNGVSRNPSLSKIEVPSIYPVS